MASNIENAGHPIFMEERQREILRLLSQNSKVLVSDLSDRFQVSAATIRNDMQRLESEGKLKRTHGGAILARTTMPTELTTDKAATANRTEKQAIGKAAAELVQDGDMFLVDSGTTTRELIRALEGKHNLTFVTNDFTIVESAERHLQDCHVIMLGGNVRMQFHYTEGSAVLANLASYYAPRVFMAASAFSIERGFSTHASDQAAFKKQLLDQADEHIMLVDSSKIGTNALVRFCGLADVDTLITDAKIDRDDRRLIETAEGAPELIIA